MSLRILSQEDVKKSISMPEAISAMRLAFAALANNETQIPLRSPIHVSEQNLSLFMPGYIQSTHSLGAKVVSVFPDNKSKGLAAINGVILLLDAHSGRAKALLEASYLTALRTGAVSGLATDLLAAPEASDVAIIGAGVQAFTQLEAVCAVRTIRTVRVYARQFLQAQAFANSASKALGVEVLAVASVREACQDADIICTATSATTPLIYGDMLKPGCHINAIGSHHATMREIESEVLAASWVVVDQKSAAMAEAGEVIHAIEHGYLSAAQLVELGDIVNQRRIEHAQPYTLFKSVGLSIQDLAVAEQALAGAIARGLGTEVQL